MMMTDFWAEMIKILKSRNLQQILRFWPAFLYKGLTFNTLKLTLATMGLLVTLFWWFTGVNDFLDSTRYIVLSTCWLPPFTPVLQFLFLLLSYRLSLFPYELRSSSFSLSYSYRPFGFSIFIKLRIYLYCTLIFLSCVFHSVN